MQKKRGGARHIVKCPETARNRDDNNARVPCLWEYDAGDELLVKPSLERGSNAQGRQQAAVRDEVLPDAERVQVADHVGFARHHFRRPLPPTCDR